MMNMSRDEKRFLRRENINWYLQSMARGIQFILPLRDCIRCDERLAYGRELRIYEH